MTKLAADDFFLEVLDPPRFPLAKQFYKHARYHSHVGKEDEAYVLRDKSQADKIVAAVRLVKSERYLILRSMLVSPLVQRQGIGSLLLNKLAPHLGKRECWCFPFEWLADFYTQIDFHFIDPKQAPPSIAESFQRYLRQGKKLTLMKRPAA